MSIYVGATIIGLLALSAVGHVVVGLWQMAWQRGYEAGKRQQAWDDDMGFRRSNE